MVLLASDYDKSRFFKADDFEGDRKLRIKNATEEVVGAEKERKLVVWFTNDERGLVLNKTNNRALRGAFGDAVNGWMGKIIIVFPTMTDVRGKMVPALRVRIPPPKHDGEKTVAIKPKLGGNGQTTAAAKPPGDEEHEDVESPPAQTGGDELDDEIPF